MKQIIIKPEGFKSSIFVVPENNSNIPVKKMVSFALSELVKKNKFDEVWTLRINALIKVVEEDFPNIINVNINSKHMYKC